MCLQNVIIIGIACVALLSCSADSGGGETVSVTVHTMSPGPIMEVIEFEDGSSIIRYNASSNKPNLIHQGLTSDELLKDVGGAKLKQKVHKELGSDIVNRVDKVLQNAEFEQFLKQAGVLDANAALQDGALDNLKVYRSSNRDIDDEIKRFVDLLPEIEKEVEELKKIGASPAKKVGAGLFSLVTNSSPFDPLKAKIRALVGSSEKIIELYVSQKSSTEQELVVQKVTKTETRQVQRSDLFKVIDRIDDPTAVENLVSFLDVLNSFEEPTKPKGCGDNLDLFDFHTGGLGYQCYDLQVTAKSNQFAFPLTLTMKSKSCANCVHPAPNDGYTTSIPYARTVTVPNFVSCNDELVGKKFEYEFVITDRCGRVLTEGFTLPFTCYNYGPGRYHPTAGCD